MTKQEALQIPDLQIKVTPAIEDAFHFLYGVENENGDVTDAQLRCGQSLETYPIEERNKAIHYAYRMLDNIKKYGVACADWCK